MSSNYPFLEIELCKKLKELGVPQKSHFFWIRPNLQEEYVLGSSFKSKGQSVIIEESIDDFQLGDVEYSAWTAEELINLMPKRISIADKTYCPLFIEKNEWHGHEDAFRCFYLSNSFAIRAKAGSKKAVEERILATIMLESEGYTLIESLAKLYIKVLEKFHGIKN